MLEKVIPISLNVPQSKYVVRLLTALLLCVPAFAQGPTANPRSVVVPAPLSGVVEDSTGAIIPNAHVELQNGAGVVQAATSTNAAGQFNLPFKAEGDFRLVVTLDGFETLLKPIHAGRTPLQPLTLNLALASVATSVTVNAEDAVQLAAPDNNADSASMSSDDLKSLPVLDGDVVATLSAFLDAGAAGEGGATLIVDGVEMPSLGVPPSAIERISINQNPYSAQYRQPGRGQIEVVTKSTADKFHGSTTFTFRDSIFNAAPRCFTYPACSKPGEFRRTYEGFLTGPIRTFRDTTFLFTIYRQEQNSSEQLDAITPPGVSGSGNILAPYRNTQLTMKVARQISDRQGVYLLYRLTDTSRANQATGGLSLASAGYTSYAFDQDLTFHDDITFGPNKLNQFNILFERNADRTVSTTQAPALIVQGAFNGGGAQNDELQTENNPNISDIYSWTVGRHGSHQIKFGAQFPNLGRRILEDNTDRQGTYTFANLAAFEANTPNTFTIQQGQSRFLTHYLQPSAFALDQIQVTERLTVTPGVRYDFQNAIPQTKAAIQPRLAVAYVLEKKHAIIARMGGGVYVRRVGVNVGQQIARYSNAAERSYLVTTNICYPASPQCTNALVAQPPNTFNYAPGLSAPFQGFFGTSIEGEVTKKSTLTIGYEGYRGWHALQSIDINAPRPPFASSTRPNPNFGQELMLSSGGIQRSDALIVSYRGRVGNYFSGYTQYTWQHARADTEYSTFQPENDYAPDNEYGRTNADERQRFNMFGTFYPDKPVTLGVGFNANTPPPYTETTGTDDFKTGILNARPVGVPRNSLNGGNYQDLQVRLGYTRKLKPKLKDQSPSLNVSLSSFNTLNRSNYEDYVGVVTSPKFGQPTSAGGPRRLQLGVAYNF